MITIGAFGGYLNYLHNFDTTEKDQNNSIVRYKYILLGIGASFLIPVFLKTISSNLLSSKDNNDYLIFAGFCLIAAIFSRRFITTIGDKILEAAKNAEKIAKESNLKSENTQLELSSTKERIEDVKLAVDINNLEPNNFQHLDNQSQKLLIELADNYVQKTSIPDYSQRLKLKAELGRKMGELIVRNGINKEELLSSQSEGMILALAYSVQLRPNIDGLKILNHLSNVATQLYTKYSILVGYDTLARNSFLSKEDVQIIYKQINNFKTGGDKPLLKKIEETINILSLVDFVKKE